MLFIFFFILSLLASFFVSFFGSLYISWSFLSSFPLTLEISFYFDCFSSWFLSVVLLISSLIIVYSYFYIRPYHKSYYFLVLTSLFVLSMCLVISMSNLFFIMLGWDGLGLVSFFLIVYYQNQSSIFSGLFTLLINRFGDGLFLCSISIYFLCFFDFFIFSSNLGPFLCLVFIVLTFITKSAIYPFSPWLPMAIAAPTPISALVHSSTLVTSGLFLMIKFSYIIYSSYLCCIVLLSLSLFTSFYAGLNTVFEKDLKKLIALSTLSHLGFIGMSFSLGFLTLSFFHLLSHALFKSLLFMSIGDIIINLGHSQDIRFLSSGSLYTPFSVYVMYTPLLNLIGFPSLAGFFSKDLILESCNYGLIGSFLYFILLLNVVFTYYYRFQLFYYSFSYNKFSPYSCFNSPLLIHSFLLSLLGICSLFFGYFFLSFISSWSFFVTVPFSVKFFPMFVLFTFIIILRFSLSLFTSHSQILNTYFSTILFLYYFITKVSSYFYYSLAFEFVKTIETGCLNSFINLKSPKFIYFLGSRMLRFSVLPNILFSILLFLFFLVPFFFM